MPQLQYRSLSNRNYPNFCDLPEEHEYDSEYYTISGSFLLRPTRHWVFLGEITHNISFVRPRYVLKDRRGDEIPIAFHHEPIDEILHNFDRARYIVGHTIAVFYAENHAFFDGTFGIRVDSLATVKLIPCSLTALLSADPAAVDAHNPCAACGKERSSEGQVMQRCSRCKTKYCCKACQLQHWKTHKEKCVALSQVRTWNMRDWDRFLGHWNPF